MLDDFRLPELGNDLYRGVPFLRHHLTSLSDPETT
jgi:hypothetical protein